MNNKYFSSLLCITILACAPACTNQKKNCLGTKDHVKTMIELDNDVIEVDRIEECKSITKF